MNGGRFVALFLDMLAAERGAAANTLSAYRRDLDDYAAFLAARGIDAAEVEPAAVRAYVASLEQRGLKASSAARRLSAVRQFHKFLYVEGYAAADPTATATAPKRARSLPKVLSVAEVDRLLAAARDLGEAQDAPPAARLRAQRMHCLLELLYASGLRVSELVALPRAAAQTRERFLIVKGKGGRERLVPLTETARRQGLRGRPREGRQGRRPLALPGRQRGRAPDPAGLRPRPQGRRRGGGPARRQGQPACAPARLREPPPPERRRPARRAGAPRPRRHRDDADLHPRPRRAAEEHGPRPAPARPGGVMGAPASGRGAGVLSFAG
jgi:integrase